VIAVDLLPIEPIPGVNFIQGDFSTDEVLHNLLTAMEGRKADWVVSDMAPNISGNPSIDIPKSIALVELALDFALKALTDKGGLLIKIFQGEGFDAFLQEVKQSFSSVAIRKPKASRGRSREVYILAKDKK
jgi:23S rRNA (uridine2552-2'-O)-methyltransferase